MRHFAQQVLVRNNWITSDFISEPIETAWASEALFFIEVAEVKDNFDGLQASVQISANGITWIDEGTKFEDIREKGLYFRKVSHFGGWLRLNCTLSGNEPTARLMVHLVLKE